MSPNPLQIDLSKHVQIFVPVTSHGRGALGREKARAHRANKIEKQLQKIIDYIRINKKISNRQIVMHLHVSDATATRYVNILVERNYIRRAGNGRSSEYILA